MRAAAVAMSGTTRSQRRVWPLWVWPSLTGAFAFAAAEVAAHLPLSADRPRWWWPGDTAAATTMVQAVATSVITVTTLTFSVTVVALQLASQQFSPRLLREFTRDPVTRLVLSTLVATFVFALTALRHFRSDQPPPVIAVSGTFALGLLSLVAVLGFITHVVRTLRVDSMMRAVHDDAAKAIAAFYPDYDDTRGAAEGLELADGEPGVAVYAERSGFIRVVHVEHLVQAAAHAEGRVRVEVRPGDHVTRGVPVATVWAKDPSGLIEAVHRGVVSGFERTMDQDAAFGFRQLEDIAVKALSPGINDPVTAAHAVGHMADLLVRLTGCRLGSTQHADADGVVRAVVPDRDLRYYLDLACDQLRRYAAGEPTVLIALLRLLRDVAVSARDDVQRTEIARQAALIRRTASEQLLEEDRERVLEMERRVLEALAGDLAGAFTDRAGETRSI